MIESITSQAVRCDGCRVILEKGERFTHVFNKDFCCKCSSSILRDIEEQKIISLEEFNQFFEDRIQK